MPKILAAVIGRFVPRIGDRVEVLSVGELYSFHVRLTCTWTAGEDGCLHEVLAQECRTITWRSLFQVPRRWASTGRP